MKISIIIRMVLVAGLINSAHLGYTQSDYQLASIEKLPVQGYHAQIEAGLEYLFYSGEAYRGLKYYNLNNHESVVVSDKTGAGYQPIISDTDVIFSTAKKKDYLFDFKEKEIKEVDASGLRAIPEDGAGASDDLTAIVVSINGVEKRIQPKGRVNYLNVSLSPNKKLVLFRVSGLGTFVSDLDGNIAYALGNVEFPKWLDNSNVIFTRTEDDGHQYLSSQVYIQALGKEKPVQLTSKEQGIAIYPDVDTTCHRVAFHTVEGEIFLLQLEKNQ